MIRKAQAVWHGTGRAGTGNLSTESGVLSKAAYSFRACFESENGANPEESIAAAHAGCFTMALAFQLQGAGYVPTELDQYWFRLNRQIQAKPMKLIVKQS